MLVRSSRIFVASAALVALPIVASSGTVVRTAPRALARPPIVRMQIANHSRRRAVADCTTNGSDAFLGGGTSNVAGGQDAAVLAGTGNQACDDNSAVGGGEDNTVFGSSDLGEESFLGAGGSNEISQFESFDGAGDSNMVDGSQAFVGAGTYNDIMTKGDDSGIGAGDENAIQGFDSFIGAGNENVVSMSGSFIGAGGEMTDGNQVHGEDSFVGAGDLNDNSGTEAFIGAGNENTIATAGTYAGILSGNNNYASGTYGAIGGGGGNKVEGAFSMIPGGADNIAAGAASFAAGYHADAAHNGSFVWSDDVSGSKVLSDTNVDQFVVRATGGTFIYSSETLASGVKLASGSGTWSSLSDRNAKTKIAPLDDASILAKVDALPVSAWEYKTEAGVRHVGPMAQDFYSAFGVGEDDEHITSIDEDGVALAAIKALHANLQRVEESEHHKDRELRDQHDELCALRDEIQQLKAQVAAIRRR